MHPQGKTDSIRERNEVRQNNDYGFSRWRNGEKNHAICFNEHVVPLDNTIENGKKYVISKARIQEPYKGTQRHTRFHNFEETYDWIGSDGRFCCRFLGFQFHIYVDEFPWKKTGIWLEGIDVLHMTTFFYVARGKICQSCLFDFNWIAIQLKSSKEWNMISSAH